MKKKKELRSFIDKLRKEWQIPGLAVGVVKENQVLMADGFGYTDLDEEEEVTSETVFATGSCTKSFTTTSLAYLVDDGLLEWDKPVKEYIPSFKMADSVATNRLTPRDLVTHISGLPGHDMVWFLSQIDSREELVGRLEYLELSKDIRQAYQYNNMLYAVAGHLVERLTDYSWEEHIEDKIFNPLQMDNANLTEEAMVAGNYAHPHTISQGQVKEVPLYTYPAMGPCGAVNASVTDMCKWLRFNINKGSYDGEQLISEDKLTELVIPRVYVDRPVGFNELSHFHGGMGWGIKYYRGHKSVGHYGGIDGFTAYTGFLPDDGIGIVLLMNSDIPENIKLIDLITYRVYDLLLGLEEIDWYNRFKKMIESSVSSDQKKENPNILKESEPAHRLNDYIGTYLNQGYGTIKIDKEDDSLKMFTDREKIELEHRYYDIFQFQIDKWNMVFPVNFKTDNDGQIKSLTIPLQYGVEDIKFSKK